MKQLNIKECKSILNKHKIKLLSTLDIDSGKKLEEASKKLKYPVVMKVFSEEIIHKSKSGLVKTNIGNKEELDKSYSYFIHLIKKKKISNYSIDVQSQIEGIEFIVGAKYDATFGYVVLFGLGGIHAELLNKVSMRICPIYSKNAYEMIEEIASKIISKKTKKKIEDILIKVSNLCAKKKIMRMTCILLM